MKISKQVLQEKRFGGSRLSQQNEKSFIWMGPPYKNKIEDTSMAKMIEVIPERSLLHSFS
jgi:hypothetical protein